MLNDRTPGDPSLPDEDLLPDYEDVLSFWFGELDALGRADDDHQARWFTKDAAFDQAVRDRFGNLHAEVAAGEREEWLATPRGRLAYVLVLDQFSRNMLRGSPEMYAHDETALAAALEGIDHGEDRALEHDERHFLYLPLMHSEDPAIQDRCVQLFEQWQADAPDALRDRLAHALKFARGHRDIVKRFGRFPHRNALLGRESTNEERAFLEGPGSSF